MNNTAVSTEDYAIRKRRASRWPVISNTVLVIAKVVVAVITGSVGILAEVVNSAADLFGSIVAFFSVRASDTPPDRTHAYGHGKIENLSGVLTASLVLVGGMYAIVQAVEQLVHRQPLARVGWGAALMCGSALVNWAVSQHMMRVGRETDSPALSADGRHLQSDVMTSLAVLAGLVLVHLTGRVVWDAIAAILVSLFILRMGVLLAADALDTLADKALPADEEAKLASVLQSHPAVLGFHKLRTRKSGSHRHIDVHVQIADTHTFVEAHRLTEELEEQLRTALPNVHPIIHTEPYDDEISIHQMQKHRDG